MTVNITEFRKNLFRYTDLVKKGYEIEVENAGELVGKLVKPVVDDRQAKAKRALELLPRLAGIWKDYVPDDEFFRGKKEKEYMKRLGKW